MRCWRSSLRSAPAGQCNRFERLVGGQVSLPKNALATQLHVYFKQHQAQPWEPPRSDTRRSVHVVLPSPPKVVVCVAPAPPRFPVASSSSASVPRVDPPVRIKEEKFAPTPDAELPLSPAEAKVRCTACAGAATDATGVLGSCRGVRLWPTMHIAGSGILGAVRLHALGCDRWAASVQR